MIVEEMEIMQFHFYACSFVHFYLSNYVHFTCIGFAFTHNELIDYYNMRNGNQK